MILQKKILEYACNFFSILFLIICTRKNVLNERKTLLWLNVHSFYTFFFKWPLILYWNHFLGNANTEIIIFITKLSPWYYSNSNRCFWQFGGWFGYLKNCSTAYSCQFAIHKFIWKKRSKISNTLRLLPMNGFVWT